MRELVVATTKVGDSMQRTNREAPGRDMARERLADRRVGEPEQLGALTRCRNDPKVVVGGPDRAGEVAHQHRELFAGPSMFRPVGLGLCSLDGDAIGPWAALPSLLTSKLVEQSERSPSPQVGLAAKVLFGELDALADELLKTRAYTADRIRFFHAR